MTRALLPYQNRWLTEIVGRSLRFRSVCLLRNRAAIIERIVLRELTHHSRPPVFRSMARTASLVSKRIGIVVTRSNVQRLRVVRRIGGVDQTPAPDGPNC